MGNQASFERNVNILSCLAYHESGPWLNARQVKTYMQGKNVDREIIRQFLEDQIIIGNVEKREAQNEKATFEYKITEKGTQVLQTFYSLSPDLKYVLNWKPLDKKRDIR